ncbi:MAG: TolC family protein [Bacteriovorax sp.]|nr:TolC family protein [Bacteriovorax sp.]
MKMTIGFVLMLGLLSARLYAGEQYSLEKAREQVANNNIKVSIAYEQYVQVKNEEQAKTLQLLPTLSVDMLVLNYQYTILRSIIPEPSRFFEVSAQKDLAEAAKVNRTIVKKNLLEDLEETFYLHQFHKEMIESFKKEADITGQIAARSQEAYDLGAISFSDYYRAQRNVITAKTQSVNGNELLKSEEYGLKLILQVKDNTDTLDIDSLKFYNGTLDYPETAQEAVTIAVNNSKEVEQFGHLIDAANKQKKGVALSWISWGGVGFDYFSRVSIAKLEVNKLELNKKKAVLEIKNQVAAQYVQIESHKEKMAYQSQLLAMAQAEYTLALASQTDLLNSFINTKRAELSLMTAQREDSKLKYELELKYIKLKRLLGTNMMTNIVPRA